MQNNSACPLWSEMNAPFVFDLLLLLYKAAVSHCVYACLSVPPFPTRPSDRTHIWHTYSYRYGREGDREGAREGTRAKPGNQLVL